MTTLTPDVEQAIASAVRAELANQRQLSRINLPITGEQRDLQDVHRDYRAGLLRYGADDLGGVYHDTNAYAGRLGDDTGYDGAKAGADASATAKGVRLSPKQYRRNANLTFGAQGVPLVLPPGAMLRPQATKKYTIAGHVDAGLYQIIDLSDGGTVEFTGPNQAIPVQWFGGNNNGTGDAALAAQQAHDSLTAGAGGTVILPQGRYRWASTYTHRGSFTTLAGDGKGTIIDFVPTANDQRAIVLDSAGAGLIVGPILRDLQIQSQDAVYRKVAVEVRFASDYSIHNIQVGPIGFWTGGVGNVAGVGSCVGDGGSIGFLWRGHDAIRPTKISCFANRPHVFDIDPDFADYDSDHFHGQDFYSSATGTNPNIEFVDGWTATEFHLDGYQAYVAGKYGLYGNNLNVFGFHVRGMRFEQASAANAWAVQLTGVAFYDFTIGGFRCGATENGIKLRSIIGVRLRDGIYDGSATGLDVNETCDDVAWDNFDWDANNVNAVTTGALKCMFGPSRPDNGKIARMRTAYWKIASGVGDAAYVMDTLVSNYKVQLAFGVPFNIPTGGSHKMGVLSIAAGDDDGSTLESAVFAITPNAVKKVAGTANTSDVNAGVNLIVFNNAGTVTVVNSFDADTVDAVITITWIT